MVQKCGIYVLNPYSKCVIPIISLKDTCPVVDGHFKRITEMSVIIFLTLFKILEVKHPTKLKVKLKSVKSQVANQASP